MRFKDLCDHEIARFCKLTAAEVFVLKYYTMWGFVGINMPLRDRQVTSDVMCN